MEAAEKMALGSLGLISAEELRKSRAGIRVSALMDAGYRTLEDLCRADDKDLAAIEGIGEGQIASIRRITAEFIKNMAAWMPVRIDPSDPEGGNLPLMKAAALLRRCGAVRRDAGQAPEKFTAFVNDVLSAGSFPAGKRRSPPWKPILKCVTIWYPPRLPGSTAWRIFTAEPFP